MEDFTLEELHLICQSLEYTVAAFESYEYYPSSAFRQARIEEARTVLRKMRAEVQKMRRGQDAIS